MRKKVNAITDFIRSGVWDAGKTEKSPVPLFFIMQLRIVLVALKGFTRDKLILQAAGLTYYTLLSVVPLVALVFAVAKGFGMERALEDELYQALHGHEEVVEQIMLFATKTLDNAKGGIIAGIGVAILLWTVMRLLANIEAAFNDIWEVPKGRPWLKKFTEFFSIMLIAPIVVILAGSITVVITAQIQNMISGVDFLATFGPIIFFLIKLIPYALIWLLFTFVYMVMPNTKVKFSSALIAGIIAGTAFQVVEWGYINFQVGVSKYNAIYGSFVALPLFLIWANLSWLITLFGAEIAFANQNLEHFEYELDQQEVSVSLKHFVGVLLCQRIIERFETGIKPYSARQLAHELDIPYRLVSNVLEHLVKAGILVETESNDEKDNAFQPAKGTGNISIASVIRDMDNVGFKGVPIGDSHAKQIVEKRFHELQLSFGQSRQNVLLKDLAFETV